MSTVRDPNRDQPLPTPGHQPVQAALIDAIAERRNYGIRKYGRPLETHNGRDSLTDAWEEALDLLTYLTQMRLERGDLITKPASELPGAGVSPAEEITTASARLRTEARHLLGQPAPNLTVEYPDLDAAAEHLRGGHEFKRRWLTADWLDTVHEESKAVDGTEYALHEGQFATWDAALRLARLINQHQE